MKFQVAAALVALLPTLGWACATYDSCLCTNTDGSFNEQATKMACSQFAGNYDQFDDGRHYCAAGRVSVGEAGGQVLAFNNCRFKTACQNNGATGDSNCWGKEWP